MLHHQVWLGRRAARALELPPLANLVFMVRVLCAWFVVLRATTKRASFCVRVCVR